jgi:hypothetical protein
LLPFAQAGVLDLFQVASARVRREDDADGSGRDQQEDQDQRKHPEPASCTVGSSRLQPPRPMRTIPNTTPWAMERSRVGKSSPLRSWTSPRLRARGRPALDDTCKWLESRALFSRTGSFGGIRYAAYEAGPGIYRFNFARALTSGSGGMALKDVIEV